MSMLVDTLLGHFGQRQMCLNPGNLCTYFPDDCPIDVEPYKGEFT